MLNRNKLDFRDLLSTLASYFLCSFYPIKLGFIDSTVVQGKMLQGLGQLVW